jgi:hypothetical protein
VEFTTGGGGEFSAVIVLGRFISETPFYLLGSNYEWSGGKNKFHWRPVARVRSFHSTQPGVVLQYGVHL